MGSGVANRCLHLGGTRAVALSPYHSPRLGLSTPFVLPFGFTIRVPLRLLYTHCSCRPLPLPPFHALLPTAPHTACAANISCAADAHATDLRRSLIPGALAPLHPCHLPFYLPHEHHPYYLVDISYLDLRGWAFLFSFYMTPCSLLDSLAPASVPAGLMAMPQQTIILFSVLNTCSMISATFHSNRRQAWQQGARLHSRALPHGAVCQCYSAYPTTSYAYF